METAVGLCMKLKAVKVIKCFIDNYLNSVNSVVEFVARNGVYFSRMYSAIGRSAQFCNVLLRLIYVILDVLLEG